MSDSDIVRVAKYLAWQKVRVTKYLVFIGGGEMSGSYNVWWQNDCVAKCLSVKMSGCQNVLV